MVVIRSITITVDHRLEFQDPNMKVEIPEYNLRDFVQGKLEEITNSPWTYKSECTMAQLGRAIDYEFINSQGQIAICDVLCSPDL